MIDALTQKDIDSLLQGAAPAAPKKQTAEVVPYNFLRPPRISKDRRSILEAIHARLALAIQSLFSSRLRIPTDVVCTAEQATFAEFILSIGNPCAAYVFNLGLPGGGQGVMDFSTDVAYFAIDRLFGGPGEGNMPSRPLTQLERVVMRGMGERVLNELTEAWVEHLPFVTEITNFESTPDTLQIANHEDNVLVANIEIRAGGFSGLMTICLPLMALESFLGDKTAAVVRQAARSGPSPSRELMSAKLLHAQVNVQARFPVFRLRARDVAALRVGQILQTGHSTDVPIEINVNGQRRFLGTLGQARRTIGVRIHQAVSTSSAPSATRPMHGRMS